MTARHLRGIDAPDEPILEMDEIQGIAIPGFFKPHQTLLYIRIPQSRTVLEHFKAFLSGIEVSTAALTLNDRRRHRRAISKKISSEERTTQETVLTAIAFSFVGLERLTPGAALIPSEAFRVGMVARSSLLGDPVVPEIEGHPSKWVVGGVGMELDALIVVAGTDRQTVTAQAKKLNASLEAIGVTVDTENGDVREDLPGHEHFGFDDGVSQPGIRGMASNNANDYITDRHIPAQRVPDVWLYGYPGQDLVWPGELVLGYPASSPDPLLPGPLSAAVPAWSKNGSFLVYRRLRQDVGLFWRTMREEGNRLRSFPGFADFSDDWLAARLVGRWPSGAPVNRVPNGDVVKLGADKFANNYFLFDSDTPPLELPNQDQTYPDARADPVGITCPLAAHIRKVNIRDSSSDMGARSSTYDRRLLRVGVPFGKPLAPITHSKATQERPTRYAEKADDPEQGNRGLLFLSIQSSIEEQFEFLQSRWINDISRPKMPGGNDMIVGQNAGAEDAVRRCAIFGTGLQQAEVSAKAQWVIPTGGGYFFVPSISALRRVIAS